MAITKRTLKYLAGVLAVLAVVTPSAAAQDEPVRGKAHGVLANEFRAPISFEPNQGQAEGRVKFLARGSGYNLFLTPSNALFLLPEDGPSDDLLPEDTSVVTMNLVGANPAPKISGRDELPGKSSYFLGSDPGHWRTNIPNFGKVQYEEVYPGIDLVYHGVEGQLEYDFVLHPGANPKTIRIEFKGAQDIRIDRRGELVLKTGHGRICFHQPIAYQGERSSKRLVTAHYRWVGRHEVGFTVGAYDSSQTLIIDPVLGNRPFDGADGRRGDLGRHGPSIHEALSYRAAKRVLPRLSTGGAPKLRGGQRGSPGREAGKSRF